MHRKTGWNHLPCSAHPGHIQTRYTLHAGDRVAVQGKMAASVPPRKSESFPLRHLACTVAAIHTQNPPIQHAEVASHYTTAHAKASSAKLDIHTYTSTVGKHTMTICRFSDPLHTWAHSLVMCVLHKQFYDQTAKKLVLLQAWPGSVETC